ncbi:MAG TPA: caspase family protein [Actinospica sp.]|jgi:hypothetical protein|nr:caspase family protein [Actinospica sp.]
MAVYALLVGIDEYESPVLPLHGACRDVAQAEVFLSQTAEGGFHPLVLRNAQATRARVIAGFREHLAAAGPGDSALFWFSGHGSLARVPKELARLEPTGMMQTMVCVDSRHDGVPDLYDKEVNILIGEIAARGVHVAAVLDCCHADGATRDMPSEERRHPDLPGLRARWQEWNQVAPDDGVLLPELRNLLAARDGSGTPEDLFHAEHVSLAACHSNQVSYEIPTDQGSRGVFSLMLLRALTESGTTYRELLGRTRSLVETRIPSQSPVLYPTVGTLSDQRFLGGQVKPPPTALTVRFTHNQWELDAGACHGIEAGTPDDPTLLGVYKDDPRQREFLVLEVRPDRTVVEPVGWQPELKDLDNHFPVVVTKVPLPSTTVHLDESAPDAEAAEQAKLLRYAIGHAGQDRVPSPYLAIVDRASADELPDLRLRRVSQGTADVLASDDTVLIPNAACGTAAEARQLAADLEHVARWRQIKALENNGSPLNREVAIEVVRALPSERHDTLVRGPLETDRTGALQVDYEPSGGGWTHPRVFIRIRNNSARQLYCVLLDLTDTFRMDPDLLPGTWIEPGGCACADAGNAINLTLPPGRPIAEGSSGTDWLKVLIAEEAIGSELFRLPRLGERLVRKAPLQPFGGVLDRLGFSALHRQFDKSAPNARHWGTATLKVVTRVPERDEKETRR